MDISKISRPKNGPTSIFLLIRISMDHCFKLMINLERVKIKVGHIMPYHGSKIDLACSLNKKPEDYVDYLLK